MENALSYPARFFFAVVLPNFVLVTLTALYLYLFGYFSEFTKIAGPSGPGPGAGNGATLLAAISVFLIGFAYLVVFLLIPSLVGTILVSTRKWSVRRNAFFSGAAVTILVAALYYALTFLFLNSIRG